MKCLTPRQTEIAHLVASGMPSREIAETLVLSLHTVNQHIADGARRLDIDGPPRRRLRIWIARLSDESDVHQDGS